MKQKNKKQGHVLDYFIGVLMIVILMLITFLLPQLYSAFSDSKDLNQVHVMDREDFSFKKLVEMTTEEKVQQMMEALQSKSELRRTLHLTGTEAADKELLEGVREALEITAQYQMLPDLSAYDIENNIVYADYYNLGGDMEEGKELAFWNIRFSDYQTFDFTLRIDANEFIIYQAELYCIEVTEYLNQFIGDDLTIIETLNGQFAEGCDKYFEAEGYDILTGKWSEEMAIMLGYERGEYAIYKDPCLNGYLKGEGIRWGFVPMTVAFERVNTVNEWGYRGIVGYFEDVYGVDVYEESHSEIN
ncbi:MAG: hypothetical protein ACI4EQ_06950 [Lachnospiraceae bacterium]